MKLYLGHDKGTRDWNHMGLQERISALQVNFLICKMGVAVAPTSQSNDGG